MTKREYDNILASIRRNAVSEREEFIASQLGVSYVLGKIMESVESLKEIPNTPESGEVMALRYEDVARWSLLGIGMAKRLSIISDRDGNEHTTRDNKNS